MLFKFTIKDFELDRVCNNLSPRTIQSYLATLYEFHEYSLQKEVVNASDVTASLVKSFDSLQRGEEA